MSIRPIDPNAIVHDEDCEGNDAAFCCPICVKVFSVNDTQMPVGAKGEKGYRKCPGCPSQTFADWRLVTNHRAFLFLSLRGTARGCGGARSDRTETVPAHPDTPLGTIVLSAWAVRLHARRAVDRDRDSCSRLSQCPPISNSSTASRGPGSLCPSSVSSASSAVRAGVAQ